MIKYSQINLNKDSLLEYISLFSLCFPKSDKYNLKYLHWLYCENPDGPAIGFDAWDGKKLIAHYVCIPASALVSGRAVNVLLSLNTATHPAYQGKGLFTKLAELTYTAGANKGFDSVYGVANANSTPGFVRKLGFQLVEPLEARIGIGDLNIDYEILTRKSQFERVWSPTCLDWRCANPCNPIYLRKYDELVQLHAVALSKLLPVYAEFSSDYIKDIGHNSWSYLSHGRIYLGLVPEGACKFHNYFEIPHMLRPSPLNFIYRSLSESIPKLEKGQVSLSFIDFDAY